MTDSKTVYVGGFDQDVDSEALYNVFSTFGDILDVTLPSDHQRDGDPVHKGFGFVEFAHAEDAYNAIDNMHENEIGGRQVICNMAQNKAGASKLGTRRAVWEDEAFLKEFESNKDKEVA